MKKPNDSYDVRFTKTARKEKNRIEFLSMWCEVSARVCARVFDIEVQDKNDRKKKKMKRQKVDK